MLRNVSCVVLAVVLQISGAASQVAGQVVKGHVLDAMGPSILTSVEVALLTPEGLIAAGPVVTGSDGAFELKAPAGGDFYIRAALEGYRTLTDGIFSLVASESVLEVEVFLRRFAGEIEGVDARVDPTAPEPRLRAAGFFTRMEDGFGDFITPEEVEQRSGAAFFSDYLRRIPRVRILGSLILFDTASPTQSLWQGSEQLMACEPNVWVDGILRAPAVNGDRIRDGDLEQGLDGSMNPADVLAIEVYRSAATTPLRWGGLNGSCGTIVIWTKG